MSAKALRSTIIAALAATAALLVLSACEVTGTATFSWDSVNPSGRVVNAYVQNESEAGVSSVSLSLEYISGAPDEEIAVGETFTGTSQNDGTYSISNNVPYGTYVLTGSKDGFAFIDQRIELTPDNEDLPDLIGVPYDNEADVSIVALWKSSFDNVDAYVTYPDAFDTDPDGFKGEAELDTPNDTLDDGGGADPGFFVGDGTSDRERLSDFDAKYASDATFGNLNISGDTSTAAVGIERIADQGSGPETVAIRAVPIDWPGNVNYDTPSTQQNLLPGGSDYAWVGVLQYYVYGASGDLSVQGESAAESGADLNVYVTQGSSVLGRYRVPDFTNVEGASLIRINLLARESDGADFYQIVPDTHLVPEEDDGTFRPASSTSNGGVLNIPGRVRS